MNERNEVEKATPFTDDEISDMIRNAREIGLSERYKASDDQLAFIADIVTTIQDRQGLGDLGTLTPENTRYRKGEGRKIARSAWYRVKPNDYDGECDKGMLHLVRQFYEHERFEVVANAVIDRLREWL